MWRLVAAILAMAALIFAAVAADRDPSLTGSPASMERQHSVAVGRDYPFVDDSAEVGELVRKGGLVPLSGSADYELARVSYPFARPEVKTFVEHLAAGYRKGCGEALVVTSLTRPHEQQPGNAHKLSVHPAGMAVDFRISRTPACRDWMEETLLSLEKRGMLDITRERHPPHYHVAVFPGASKAVAALFPATTPAVAARQDSATPAIVPIPAGTRNVPVSPPDAPEGGAALPPPSPESLFGTGGVSWAVLIVSALGLLALGVRAVRRRNNPYV